MANDMMITKGTIFLLSEGEYSDYQVTTLCRATKDFDRKEIVEEAKSKGFGFQKFNAWLVNKSGVAEEIDFSEWHLGCYGKFEFYPLE